MCHPTQVRPGHLLTKGPGAYKIPSFNDVPHRFNVSLLRDSPNPRAIHSSKAVGEPPLFLAASAFFAARAAVAAARADSAREAGQAGPCARPRKRWPLVASASLIACRATPRLHTRRRLWLAPLSTAIASAALSDRSTD